MIIHLSSLVDGRFRSWWTVSVSVFQSMIFDRSLQRLCSFSQTSGGEIKFIQDIGKPWYFIALANLHTTCAQHQTRQVYQIHTGWGDTCTFSVYPPLALTLTGASPTQWSSASKIGSKQVRQSASLVLPPLSLLFGGDDPWSFLLGLGLTDCNKFNLKQVPISALHCRLQQSKQANKQNFHWKTNSNLFWYR